MNASLAALAALTVTVKPSAPVATSDPAMASSAAVSALVNTRLAVATPLVKVSVVELPTAVPPTVGFVPEAEARGPLKVSVLFPV